MKKLTTKSTTFLFALFFLPHLSFASNGCGTGWNTNAVRDSYGGANFRDACDSHDACYETCGQTKVSCDKAIRSDMKDECRATFRKSHESLIKDACLKVADGYYEAIKKAGSGAYKDAQKKSNCSSGSSMFSWSHAGPISGKHCVQINEPSEGDDGSTHTWADNYLCSSQDHGIQWSHAGPIDGMRCTKIHELASPHTWDDNYLCVPHSSQLHFSWSSAGPIPEKRCIKVNEPADPHTWDDNYLCY